MGLEAACRVEFGKQSSEGKALLETTELLFRGDFRLQIPFSEIRTADAKRGVLAIAWKGGSARFHLGAAAKKWLLKIRYPKPLIDKIGIKPGMAVWLAGPHKGVGEDSFWQDLDARATASDRAPRAPVEAILFFAAHAAELKQLAALGQRIVPDGFIWVIYPKGRQEICEADVMAGGKQAGLVDVKIASFSAQHSAMKLMIPLARRDDSPPRRKARGG